MNTRELRKFFLSIVLPSILAIALFVISFYVIVIPSFERNMMNGKREMISELTNSVTSLVSDYYNRSRLGVISEDEAKRSAALAVSRIRYGDASKDYFWITDMRPYMIMHPYRSDLDGKDLSDYIDPMGKRLFVEAVSVVREEGDGFINYIWQWKDDTTRLVSKLSYVRGFPEWEWIIGTGIYLEDVHREILLLERKLLRISIVIVLVIAATLVYIVINSLKIERKRGEAEEKLKLSRQKYKTLIETSATSTLMILGGRIIFTNQKFNDLCKRERGEIISEGFDGLFESGWQMIADRFTTNGLSVNFETRILLPDGERSDVVLSVSRIRFDNRDGYIINVREIDQATVMARSVRKLDDDLQLSLLIMTQAVGRYSREPLYCLAGDYARDIAIAMTRRKRDVIFVKVDGSVAGFITDSDLRERVLAVHGSSDLTASTIMTAPVPRIESSASVYEALAMMEREKRSFLVVADDPGIVTGYVGKLDLLQVHGNYISNIIRDIGNAVDVTELGNIYTIIPPLVDALIQSGARSDHLSLIVSSVSDAITRRVIDLSVEETGMPPCRYSFIVMGSEGREEQTLATDQDNAIILDDSCDRDMASEYFLKLAGLVNQKLNKIGYSYCRGEVMARNPKWTQPLHDWKKYFTGWINNSDPQSLLDLSIMFDFRHIYGDIQLCNELRRHVNLTTRNKSVFFYHLSQTVHRFKSPLGLFGQIKGERDSADSSVDLKKLMMPLTGFIRIYSIFHQVDETNSLQRLNSLIAGNHLDDISGDDLYDAFSSLLLLRFKTQAEKIISGRPADNSIDLNSIHNRELAALKEVVSIINTLLTKLKSDFRGLVE